MNCTKFFLGLALVLSSITSFAASTYLDSEPLRHCGGYVTLREAGNGDLALNFRDLNTNRCDNLKFYDASSGAFIKHYDIRGTSYTLSNTQREALSQDCRLGFDVYGSVRDYFSVVLTHCRPVRQPSERNSDLSFQWSSNDNCKVLRNGV